MVTQVPEPPWFDETGAPTDQLRAFFEVVNGIETEITVNSDDLSETTAQLDNEILTTGRTLDQKSGIRYEKIQFTGSGVNTGAGIWTYTATHGLGSAEIGVCWFKDISNSASFWRNRITENTIELDFGASFNPETEGVYVMAFAIDE